VCPFCFGGGANETQEFALMIKKTVTAATAVLMMASSLSYAAERLPLKECGDGLDR
jgi:hypothetical protein